MRYAAPAQRPGSAVLKPPRRAETIAGTDSGADRLLQNAAETVPHLVWTAGADGALDYCNKRWSDYTGLGLRKSSGTGWLQVVHPDDRERCLALWREALARGDRFETEYRLRRRRDRSYRWFLVRALPLRDASRAVAEWFGTCTDIDDQRRANDAMRFLLQVSEILASAASIDTALQDVTRLAVPSIADWCLIYLVSKHGHLYLAAMAHEDAGALAAAKALLAGAPILDAGHVRKAFEADAPILVPNITRSILRQNFSGSRGLQAARTFGARAAMGLPLRARGRTYGVLLMLSAASGRAFAEADRTLAQLVAKRAAVALDNARLFDEERHSAARLQFLSDATKSLAASLDLRRTLDTLLAIVVPSVCDWAAINLSHEDGVFRIAAIKHRDAHLSVTLGQLRGTRIDVTDAAVGTGAVVHSGKTEIYRRVSSAELGRNIDAAVIPLFEQAGVDSAAFIPLRSRGRVLGSLAAVWSGAERGRVVDEKDITLLEELAARAGAAIENAQLYERQHHVASTLQQAFLPADFPHVPGVRFDAVYASGHDETEIGGDWYDAMELPDGRLFFSVGDVAGRGLPAAVTMGKTRQSLRSFALAHQDVLAVVAAANESLRLEDAHAMVTMVVGIIDRGAQTLAYALAGHPRPFMRMQDGTIVELQGEGVPLGVRSPYKGSLHTVPFPLGATLVCYTDGLTENTRDLFEGERRLRAAMGGAAMAAERPAQALLRSVISGAQHDDVAVLTISIQPTYPGELHLTLPAVPMSAQKVRHAVRAFAHDLQVSSEKDYDIQLAVGEAVNNVIEHAYGAGAGDMWVNAQTAGGKLVVEIADRGTWRMPREDHGGRGLRIIESLCESVVVHSGKDRSFVKLVFDLGP
ncbi:MAG: SpoIIE family protein phosphatase [Candidatus Eremiobacteraeota bacterium]|nr:SpoIIE family protein phosphatase [Candidatus Eremiobacteraeota bacterium]